MLQRLSSIFRRSSFAPPSFMEFPELRLEPYFELPELPKESDSVVSGFVQVVDTPPVQEVAPAPVQKHKPKRITVSQISAPKVPIQKPPAVRLAVPEDEDALYALLVALHANNPMGHPYDPVKVLNQIRFGVAKTGAVIGVVDGPDRTIIASVGLFPHQPWYTEDWCLSELWLFVHPEIRRKGLHRQLFQFMQWVSQELGVEVLTNVVTRDRLPLKERLWSRFAERIGGLYLIKETK